MGCKKCAEGVCGCSKNAESEYEVVHLKGGHLVAKFIHIDCPMTKEIDGWDVEDGEIQFFDPDDYPTGVCATCGKSVTLSDKDNAWVQTWYEDEEWDAESCGSKVMNWESYDRPVRKAEEPTVQEPDFMPNGDGRAIGQQNFAINLSPLHAESFNAEDSCLWCEEGTKGNYRHEGRPTDYCSPFCYNKGELGMDAESPSPTSPLYIKNSSIFDNRKYDARLYIKILKEAGATKVWLENAYGWSNQPKVVIFTGLSMREAEKALAKGVSYGERMMIHSKDAHWDAESFAADVELVECGNCNATIESWDSGWGIDGIDYCGECFDTICAKQQQLGMYENFEAVQTSFQEDNKTDSWKTGVIRQALSSGCFSKEYADFVAKEIGYNQHFNAELGFKCKFCGSTAEGLDTWDDDYCSRACEKGLTVCGISDGKGQNGSYGEFCDIQYVGKSDADDNKIIIHIGCPNCEFSEDGWGMSFNQEMEEGYRAESFGAEGFKNCDYCRREIDLSDNNSSYISCEDCGKIACGSYKCNQTEQWDDFLCGECSNYGAETTGSPSPTFNEGITGQDGPSDSPTNSNFSAETFEAMQRYSPCISDVDAARRKIKAHSSWGEVVYDRYLVNQQGSSNKFYYTAIAEKDGRFYPLGAWGRIGYMNTVNIYNALGKKENPSAHLPTMKGAYNVVKDKEMSKINARKSEKRYVDSTLTKWDAESLSEIEGPTAEATAGGLHSPSSFDMTWEDGTGQSSASIPPNEIAWAENTGFPTWAKLGAGIAVLYGVGKVITARVSEQKSADNAVKARKGCCGKSAEAKTVRKNSEFSVGQINPVVVEGESDVHGAEEVKLSKPHQGPQSTHYSNERPSQKMW